MASIAVVKKQLGSDTNYQYTTSLGSTSEEISGFSNSDMLNKKSTREIERMKGLTQK